MIVVIASGIGGGLLIANMVNPQTTKEGTEMSLLERRKAAEPLPLKGGPSEPVQYLPAPSLPAPAAATPVAEQPAPPTEAVNSTVTAAMPTAQPAVPPAEPATPDLQEKRRGSSQDAFSKAQEADIKRDADAKRLADKRKAERERRQQWADSAGTSSGKSRSCARSRTGCGKKPNPGAGPRSNRHRSRCRRAGYSVRSEIRWPGGRLAHGCVGNGRPD